MAVKLADYMDKGGSGRVPANGRVRGPDSGGPHARPTLGSSGAGTFPSSESNPAGGKIDVDHIAARATKQGFATKPTSTAGGRVPPNSGPVKP